MPKVRTEKSSKAVRHNPLGEDIINERDNAGIRRVPRVKGRNNVGDDEEMQVLPAKVTQKVLQVAQAQKEADDKDFGGGIGHGAGQEEGDADEMEHEDICDVEVDEDGFVMGTGTTEEEERALAMFLPEKSKQVGASGGQTLGDIIFQKIQQHQARGDDQPMDDVDVDVAGEGMSPKVIQVYTDIGKWLNRYKSGKLPKAFKVIPSLANWEEVLSLTAPLGWSPAAMYEAVAVFASNLNPKLAQRFYNLVLLPAVRQNIAQYQKLNFHYFRSLRKALFKPAAFFKGIMLPLAMENCTLREAMILSSVVSKASVPPMHAAATLVRLCEMTPWYGTTAVFIASLVNKKYALPIRVIEGLVSHFCAFAHSAQLQPVEGESLPLVWHRALLVFVQRYKFDLNEDQLRRIKELLKVHYHESIGPEVRRELLAPKPGEAPTAAGQSDAMDLS
eukprot:TRINITY_DN21134_c0_g1_i1.p1 TRINITY_DN21134_c0_g1~~TRINITY_DN21134_c0_g1_i1.p1  ORF type:complete len:446 (-),score=92.11 TRINITY_DN21134_c0_g1_i1:421-1758(-)